MSKQDLELYDLDQEKEEDKDLTAEKFILNSLP